MRGVLAITLEKSYPPELTDRETYESYRGRYLANDPVGFAHANRMLARTNVVSMLPAINVPTMVVGGRQDTVRPARRQPGDRQQNSERAFRSHRCRTFHADHRSGGAARAAEGFSRKRARLITFQKGFTLLMQIKANGITFNYRIEGPEGAPWLVFSNSLATNLSMWDEQAAALNKSFRDIAL